MDEDAAADKEDEVVCPFWNENGFDLVGLKHHLFNYCMDFKVVQSIEEEAADGY